MRLTHKDAVRLEKFLHGKKAPHGIGGPGTCLEGLAHEIAHLLAAQVPVTKYEAPRTEYLSVLSLDVAHHVNRLRGLRTRNLNEVQALAIEDLALSELVHPRYYTQERLGQYVVDHENIERDGLNVDWVRAAILRQQTRPKIHAHATTLTTFLRAWVSAAKEEV